ncbi:unnamed protein product [Peronospora destructor]|uniref:RRM domain-containing protein n=1 Tax=Peronospora destructor TaxID=86335 RepID=A0AAV0VF60_9STRA|nr:unnamed protein product [Peronospora destructor]
MSGTRVYVGNLPMDIRTREVEGIFYKYGRIRDIDVKFPSRPPAFAFVDFEDSRDAEDAIRGRDGYEYDGARLRVEPANGGRRESGQDSGRDSTRGSTRYPRNIRGTGDFTVEVSNLPPRVSWQDLKDFMRKAGDVVFTEVDGRGGGIVEYGNKRDMKYAVEKLDDSEYRGRSENSYVRVRIAGSRDKSRSRSNSRSRSRSRSARRSGKKRSCSRSEEKDGEGEKKARRSRTPDKEPVKENEHEKDETKEDGKQAETSETASAIDKKEQAEPTKVDEEDESVKEEEVVVDKEADKNE